MMVEAKVRVERQKVELLTKLKELEILRAIEKAGRVCYKSEKYTTKESAKAFVVQLIKNGHESVLEHKSITVRFITDRGVTHELVRHRIASYSQESTRYISYKKGIQVILPVELEGLHKTDRKVTVWENAMKYADICYRIFLEELKMPSQFARSVLPTALKTEIITTMNLREWRHVLKLRTSQKAHPQMRDLMRKTLKLFVKELPVIFGDIGDGR